MERPTTQQRGEENAIPRRRDSKNLNISADWDERENNLKQAENLRLSLPLST
jgi:hypothetical protein